MAFSFLLATAVGPPAPQPPAPQECLVPGLTGAGNAHPTERGLLTVEADYSPTRLTRARYPNGNWEADMWGLCSTNNCLKVGPAYTTPER